MVFPWRGCQQCEVCSAGENHMCANNQSATTEIGQGQHSGGFAEFVAVPECNLAIKVPVSVPPHIACMLPCSAGVAYSAIMKAKPFLDNAVRTSGVANLLVIGCGGVGLWVVILTKAILCNPNIKVVCADINSTKLDAAAQLGADDIIQWDKKSSIPDLVTATTVSGYNKIAAAIDLVGIPRTFEIAFNRCIMVEPLLLLDLAEEQSLCHYPCWSAKNISIQGIRVVGLAQFKEFVDIFAVQNANVYPPVDYFSLDNINDAIEKLCKGEISGRAIIKYI